MRRSCSIGLLVAAALALAAVLAPGGATAAVCPHGQAGTPPYCVKPPPKACPAGETGAYPYCTQPPVAPSFEIESVSVKGRPPSVVVAVNLPGWLNLQGDGVKGKTRRVLPGTTRIRFGLARAAKRELAKTGKLSLEVDLRYTPDGSAPMTKTIKIRISGVRRKHHPHRHHKHRHHGHRHRG